MTPATLFVIAAIFGLFPGVALRLIVLLYPKEDPRRRELVAELYVLNRMQRVEWVFQQLETALFEGLSSRLAQRRDRRSRDQADDHDRSEPVEPPPRSDDGRLPISTRRAGGVPPEVWEKSEMRDALAAREVSSIYKQLRRNGVSQRQIAAMTGQSQSEVSEILKGRQVMAYDVLVRIADGLGIPKAYMGLVYERVAESEETEHVKRRRFLAHAAQVAVGTNVLGADARSWVSDSVLTPVPEHIGVTDVRTIEAATRALRSLDYQHRDGFYLDAVVAQLTWGRQMLDSSGSDGVKRRLQIALAELHNLAGWTSFGIGLVDEARNHFGMALELARAGDAEELVANILYRMGRVYLHQDAPDEALKMFQLGQVAAQQAGAELAIAVICANKAWAHMMMGHEEMALESLGRVREELSRVKHADLVKFFSEEGMSSQ
jgi:transcriptional regulator with XRE-family HTH domain